MAAGDELLPAGENLGEAFRSEEYWNSFFVKRGDKPFEWYSSWPFLRPLLRAALGAAEGAPQPYTTRLLVVGCGNSDLSAQLYDDGFENVTNVDFSKVCIADMLRKNLRLRPRMKWLVMDATAMKFDAASFDAVLDKGALDALMGEEGEEGERQGAALLAECARCAAGGVVAVVSLLQDHVLRLLLRTFRAGWALSIEQVPASPDMFTSPLQPFLVLARAAASAAATHPPVQLRTLPGVGVNAAQARDVRRLVESENAARGGGPVSSPPPPPPPPRPPAASPPLTGKMVEVFPPHNACAEVLAVGI